MWSQTAAAEPIFVRPVGGCLAGCRAKHIRPSEVDPSELADGLVGLGHHPHPWIAAKGPLLESEYPVG